MGGLLYSVVMENPLSRFLIRPVFRGVGSVLGYVIPDSVKGAPGFLYRKIIGTYASQDFVTALL